MVLGNQVWAEGCDIVGVQRDGDPEVIWELSGTISSHFLRWSLRSKSISNNIK